MTGLKQKSVINSDRERLSQDFQSKQYMRIKTRYLDTELLYHNLVAPISNCCITPTKTILANSSRASYTLHKSEKKSSYQVYLYFQRDVQY